MTGAFRADYRFERKKVAENGKSIQSPQKGSLCRNNLEALVGGFPGHGPAASALGLVPVGLLGRKQSPLEMLPFMEAAPGGQVEVGFLVRQPAPAVEP